MPRRGNLLVQWFVSAQHVRILYREIATPVCGLARNDSGSRKLDAPFYTA